MSKRRKALVTGASRGIGKEIAINLAKKGYDLLIIARSKRDLDAVKTECLPYFVDVESHIIDLSDPEAVSFKLSKMAGSLNAIDIIVNNHGVHYRSEMVDADDGQIVEMINTNLTSSISLTKICLHLVINAAQKRKNQQHIIFISSMAGKLAIPGSAVYAACKHGITGFANSLREEVRHHGIKVSTLFPGFVNSREVIPNGLDRKKMIQIDEMVRCFNFLLDSPPESCVTEINIKPQFSPYIETE